ncbi:MAG: hypothetical protein DHS20C05_19590 [Hyphococcus sp.]|nr:MAG: hypothetical protein DHS20C05_19590 [Marinicaulis sp.]
MRNAIPQRVFSCAFTTAFLAVSAAFAAPDEAAHELFTSGDYETAADQAVLIGGPENLALAARALNASAYLEADNKRARKMAKRALKHSQSAAQQDPMLVEAHLQAAISTAQLGARRSPVRAFLSGSAGKTRKLLDAALMAEPENAWALSSSGAWHLEVSRRAGVGRFGSDPWVGRRQFLAAHTLAPDNLPIAYECALRMLAYDEPRWREEGLAVLYAALKITPKNAFEVAVRTRAFRFSEAIEKGRAAERAFILAQP